METEVRIFRSSSTRAMVGMSLPFAANAAPHRALKPAKLGRNVSFGRIANRTKRPGHPTLLRRIGHSRTRIWFTFTEAVRSSAPRSRSAEARRNIEERKLFRSSKSSQEACSRGTLGSTGDTDAGSGRSVLLVG